MPVDSKVKPLPDSIELPSLSYTFDDVSGPTTSPCYSVPPTPFKELPTPVADLPPIIYHVHERSPGATGAENSNPELGRAHPFLVPCNSSLMTHTVLSNLST
jgi:hypothetical protein